MRDWTAYLLFFFVSLVLLLNGLLMLVSPQNSLKLVAWLSRVYGSSKPNPNWKAGLDLQRRLAGLGMALGGFFLAAIAISFLLHPAPAQQGLTQPVEQVAPDWHSFGVGLVAFVGGLYVLIKPQRIVHWSARRMPHLVVPESTLRTWGLLVRVMGAMAIVGGIVALRAWLKGIG